MTHNERTLSIGEQIYLQDIARKGSLETFIDALRRHKQDGFALHCLQQGLDEIVNQTFERSPASYFMAETLKNEKQSALFCAVAAFCPNPEPHDLFTLAQRADVETFKLAAERFGANPLYRPQLQRGILAMASTVGANSPMGHFLTATAQHDKQRLLDSIPPAAAGNAATGNSLKL